MRFVFGGSLKVICKGRGVGMLDFCMNFLKKVREFVIVGVINCVLVGFVKLLYKKIVCLVLRICLRVRGCGGFKL